MTKEVSFLLVMTITTWGGMICLSKVKGFLNIEIIGSFELDVIESAVLPKAWPWPGHWNQTGSLGFWFSTDGRTDSRPQTQIQTRRNTDGQTRKKQFSIESLVVSLWLADGLDYNPSTSRPQNTRGCCPSSLSQTSTVFSWKVKYVSKKSSSSRIASSSKGSENFHSLSLRKLIFTL